MFQYEWKCAWGHVDPHGIAYYPRLVNAMHRAGEEFMDDIGVAYWEIPDYYDVHLPIVAMDTEFKRPVEVGDTIQIAVEPEVGDKSLGIDFTATHDDGSTAYTGHEQHVCVSTAENQSQPLPEPLKQVITDASD